MPKSEADSHQERTRWLSALILGGAGAFLLLLGIAVHHPETKAEFASSFLEHLGIGLIAVALLKFFIEQAAEQQFLDLLRTDVKEQVGTTVISFIRRGSWILTDQVLKKELEDSILLPHFTRPKYNLGLKLEPLEGHDDLLKVWITMDYEVKNVSDSPRSYMVGSWLENTIQLEDLEPECRPGFRSVTIGGADYPIENLIAAGKTSGTGSILYEEQMIQLRDLPTPPIDLEQSISVTVTGMQIMRKADHFTWNLPTITHKLGLLVELAGGLTFDQLEVCPREMHHMSHEEFIKPKPDLQTNTWTLSIDHVVLPFQGIELRWAPRPTRPSSTILVSETTTT